MEHMIHGSESYVRKSVHPVRRCSSLRAASLLRCQNQSTQRGATQQLQRTGGRRRAARDWSRRAAAGGVWTCACRACACAVKCSLGRSAAMGSWAHGHWAHEHAQREVRECVPRQRLGLQCPMDPLAHAHSRRSARHSTGLTSSGSGRAGWAKRHSSEPSTPSSGTRRRYGVRCAYLRHFLLLKTCLGRTYEQYRTSGRFRCRSSRSRPGLRVQWRVGERRGA